MYKEPAVRVPSITRLKEIAQGLRLDLEEAELQEYQSMSRDVVNDW